MKLQYLGNANDHDALKHLLLLLLLLFGDARDERLMQSESEHTLLARPAVVMALRRGWRRSRRNS